MPSGGYYSLHWLLLCYQSKAFYDVVIHFVFLLPPPQDLLSLLAFGHPAARCRAGASAALARLDAALWPAGQPAAGPLLAQLRICGQPPPEARHSWVACRWAGLRAVCVVTLCAVAGVTSAAFSALRVVFMRVLLITTPAFVVYVLQLTHATHVACRGSVPGARGYTCGLWTLFHSASVRLKGPGGGAMLMAGLRAFGRHFFQCDDCRAHFLEILNTTEAEQVISGLDILL